MSTTAGRAVTAAPSEPAAAAIEAIGLVKSYGTVRALDGVSFSVPAGDVLGLLGPNGAGKSTIVKILTTLSAPDEGTATVAGFDVVADAPALRHAIGCVPQKPCSDPTATGRENLCLQGRIHGLTAGEARDRAAELLERLGLADAADRVTRTWSGGMRRRLDVALGLVGRPRVLVLDEPTTGLDPESRARMWTGIEALRRSGGLTVLLSTQYLEEADRLADRLLIVDGGRVVAEGTPDALKEDIDRDAIGGAPASLDDVYLRHAGRWPVPTGREEATR